MSREAHEKKVGKDVNLVEGGGGGVRPESPGTESLGFLGFVSFKSKPSGEELKKKNTKKKW